MLLTPEEAIVNAVALGSLFGSGGGVTGSGRGERVDCWGGEGVWG